MAERIRITEGVDVTDIKLSQNAKLVLNNFFSYLRKSSTRESMHSYIDNISYENTFNSLNTYEQ